MTSLFLNGIARSVMVHFNSYDLDLTQLSKDISFENLLFWIHLFGVCNG